MDLNIDRLTTLEFCHLEKNQLRIFRLKKRDFYRVLVVSVDNIFVKYYLGIGFEDVFPKEILEKSPQPKPSMRLRAQGREPLLSIFLEIFCFSF